MGEAKQLRHKILMDINAMKQDNASWKRQITENELRIIQLEKIANALKSLCDGGGQE